MSRARIVAVTIAIFVGAILMRGAAAQNALPRDAEVALQKAGFTAAELQSLNAGQVIAKVDTADNGEILSVGAVRIRAARAQTTAYYGQMISYVDGQVTLAFGKFGNPPAIDDVKGLSLDPKEIDAIRSCKPGNCDLRIGGTGLDAIRRSIDWKAPDAAERVQNAARQAVVAYATAYTQRGDEALVTYTDTSKPVSLAEQWRGILANSAQLQQTTPALVDYVAKYPKATLPGARDILYWIKENYGMKPTISIVHGVVYQPPDRPDRTFVVQKQIYASHYYDASLATAVLLDAGDAAKPVTLLLYANRSRGDMLKGGFGGLKRKVARDQARSATVDTLGTIQKVLEQSPGAR